MWSCFLMDRFNSSGTERPIFVGEHYIRAQLPIKDKYYQMEVTGPTEDLEGNVPNPVEPNTGQMSDAKEKLPFLQHSKPWSQTTVTVITLEPVQRTTLYLRHQKFRAGIGE